MKKPLELCLFSSKWQSCLKRHILAKLKNEKIVSSILHLGEKEQNHHIKMMRKHAIKIYNIKEIENSGNEFIIETRNTFEEDEVPVICTGCMRFYSKFFKARLQLSCQGSGTNIMIPMISVNSSNFEKQPDDFKELLQASQQDSIGD